MTAAELMEQLEADPEWVARRAERDARHAEAVAQLRVAEQPVVQALAAVGIVVDSMWDLLKPGQSYPAALPVLLRHLDEPYPDAIREGIARALGVREANHLWTELVARYRVEVHERVQHGLAVALTGAATKAELGEIIELVSDRRNGTSRGLLLHVLSRSRDPRASVALHELRDDPDLQKEIAHILRQREKQTIRKAALKP